MNLPKWSVIAATAIAVIAVIIIVMPGKQDHDGEKTASAEMQKTESNMEGREEPSGKENTETADTDTAKMEKETASAAIVIDPDQETEESAQEKQDVTDAEETEVTEVTEETESPEEAVERKEAASEGLSGDAAEIAEKLSTNANANAADFEWFMDMELFEGNEAGVIVTEPGRTERITGSDNAFLNGGWKAYQLDTIKKPYNPETVRYYNAEIDTEGEKFSITMNWAYMFMPEAGQSVEENGSDLFEGTWDPEAGTATAQSKWAKVEFDHFYIASDRSAEYATGTFYWISGETERIALMRVAKEH